MNNKNVKVVDEHSIDRSASVMFAFDLEGSEYVTYWIERDEDNSNIFVSKVIKNLDGTFNMLDIDDSMEKSKLADIVKTLVTTAVNDESDKLDGTSVTLSDGKVIKLMAVSFNKEQRINVQKTYITTVKKEVTRVSEKYYDVEVSLEQPKIFEDIFPTVNPSAFEVDEEIKVDVPELNVPVMEPIVSVEEDIPVVEPVISEPVLSTSIVEDTAEVKTDDFVAFGTETTIPDPEVTPQVIPTVTPVVAQIPDESKVESEVLEAVPSVVESITVAEPIVNVVAPEPINVLPSSEPAPVEPLLSTSEDSPKPSSVNSQPLVFNAAKETNLNAALGEVASSTSIPVDNIETVREFGVDEVAKIPTDAMPSVNTPVQPDVVTGQKAGFANSKFFVVVAVAFFLAACIFLGYEVYNYFQLTK